MRNRSPSFFCWIAEPRAPGVAQETIASMDELLAHKVALKPELVGVHRACS